MTSYAGPGRRTRITRNPLLPARCKCDQPVVDGHHCVKCGHDTLILATVVEQIDQPRRVALLDR